MIKSLVYILSFAILAVGLCSCGSTKKLQYMQGAFDTARLSGYNIPVPVIQKGDLLSITVYSDNPVATSIYNQSVISTSSTGASNAASPGYLVDEQGNIVFQGLGNLHVEGLTKPELTEMLAAKLKPFLTNAYFNIRFINYKITIIGDIAKPAVYTVPAEKINLLEALGLAGDLNITARRDNILIIREQNGKRTFGRIDITKPDIFLSPFYNLQQNDMVYVDFNKNKAAANDAITLRNVAVITSVVSTLAIIYSIFRR